MFKPLNIELYTEYINEKIRKKKKKKVKTMYLFIIVKSLSFNQK